MANLLSTVLTSADNGVVVDAGIALGIVQTSRGIITLAAAPGDDNVLMMLELPSASIPHSMLVFNDDSGASVEISIGIYAGAQFVTAEGNIILKNAPISDDAFGQAATFLQTANTLPEEVRHTASGNNNTVIGGDQALWEIAQLTEDPQVPLRIGLLLETTWSAFVPGSITLIVSHTSR